MTSKRIVFTTAVVAFALGGCSMMRGMQIASTREAYNTGLSAMQQKQWARAEESFAKIPPGDQAYGQALLMRGQVAVGQESYAQATGFMKQAEQADPSRFKTATSHSYHWAYAHLLVTSAIAQAGAPRTLLVGGDALVVHSDPSVLTAHDRVTRQPIWSYQLSKHLRMGDHPVQAAGVVVGIQRGNDKSELIALETKSGKELWRQDIGTLFTEAEIATDGTRVFVAAEKPKELHAHDLRTGAPLWQKPLDGEPGPITTAGGRVFVRTGAKTLYGFKADDGADVFSVSLPPAFKHDRLAATATKVYLAGNDGKVYALDASERKYDAPLQRVLWEAPIGDVSIVLPAPAVIGGKLVVPTVQGVGACDAETGKPLWLAKFELPLGGLSSLDKPVAVEAGGLIVAKYNRMLVAITPTGAVRWIYSGDTASTLADAEPTSLDGQILAGAKHKDTPAVVTLSSAPATPY